LKKGADPALVNKNGNGALITAFIEGYSEIVEEIKKLSSKRKNNK